MCKFKFAVILGFILSFVYVMLADAEGEIVFTKLAEGGCYIYKMDSDGGNVKQLTNGPGNCPRWSPDGKFIIFNKIDNEFNRELWIMDVKDGHAERLYEPAYWGSSWSPDGKKIAFSTFSEDIFIMNLETREITPLVRGIMPIWSPDGNTIAYSPPFGTSRNLFHFIDPGTGRKWNIDLTKENLAAVNFYGCPVAWSPDGKQIAFMGMLANKNWWGIYIMNSDGTNVKEKYTGDGSNLVAIWPSWSPDGKEIVFYTPRGIERMDVDRKTRKLIHPGGQEPDWQRYSAFAVSSRNKTTTTWGNIKIGIQAY